MAGLRRVKLLAAGATAVLVLVGLAGCTSPEPGDQLSFAYTQELAQELPSDTSSGPVVTLSDDGRTLTVGRSESPACWTLPQRVAWDQEGVLHLALEYESPESANSCPSSAAWVVSEITFEEAIPRDGLSLEISSPFITDEDSHVDLS